MDINEAKAVIKSIPMHIAVNLRGPPGIGKTFGIQQLGEETKARVWTFLACTMDPTDMSGIPMKDEKGFTVFAPPEWAYFLSTEAPEKYQGPAVAFFDDLPTADEYVQAAFFRMVHERAVGRFQFRNDVRIIAAGNRTSDKAAAKEMPTPLRNRFLHLDVDMDSEKWANWAIQNGMFPGIVAYIRRQPNKLSTFNPKSNDYSFATPRTWHLTSDCLKGLGGRVKDHYAVVAGLIGEGNAIEFQTFCDHTASVKDPREILKDPTKIGLPKKTEIDILYATTSGLASYVTENPSIRNMEGSFQYALRLNPEFGVILAGDIHECMLNSKKVDGDDRMKVIGGDTFTQITEKYSKFMV